MDVVLLAVAPVLDFYMGFSMSLLGSGRDRGWVLCAALLLPQFPTLSGRLRPGALRLR